MLSSLLDTGFSRVTFVKMWVLRCHGCWKVCKDTSKQFCPSCGQPTLTRVSCSTDASGNFLAKYGDVREYVCDYGNGAVRVGIISGDGAVTLG